MARRDASGVRLISRNGNDLATNFPLAAVCGGTAGAIMPYRLRDDRLR
jgi:hypothetical protein